MDKLTKSLGIALTVFGMAWAAAAQNSASAGDQAVGTYNQQSTTPNSDSDVGQNGQSSNDAASGQPVVLIDPAKIYNENPAGWVGKQVVLQNVLVQDTNDDGNFWVGSDSHHRLLIVKQKGNDTLKAMSFHKGDVVTISGTVEAASKYM